MENIKQNLNNAIIGTWDLHRAVLEEARLPRCCAVWFDNLLPEFQRNIPPSSSGFWVNSQDSWLSGWQLYVPPTSGSNYRNTQPNSLEHLLLQALQLIKSFNGVLFPFGNAASFPHDLSRVFRCNLSFSVPHVTQVTQRHSVIMGACLGGVREILNGRYWEKYCLSLSLSLSHMRARSRTYTHARELSSNGVVWQVIHHKLSLVSTCLVQVLGNAQ